MSQWLRAQQERMAAIGLYQAGIDGAWGPSTEKAFELAIAAAERSKGVTPPAYPGLTAKYRWLLDIGPLPLMVHEMLKILGTTEVPGAANSPIIMGWAKELGIEAQYTSDATAWCGLGMGAVAQRAKKDITPVGNVLWARNWGKFGLPVTGDPWLGDVAVFRRGTGGHVAQVIGIDDAGYIHIAGCNQDDAVNIMRKHKKDLICYRRPHYTTPPASARTFRVAATGAISRNEA